MKKLIILIIFLSSCSAQYRLNKLRLHHPELFKTQVDTAYHIVKVPIKDTIIIPADTAKFYFDCQDLIDNALWFNTTRDSIVLQYDTVYKKIKETVYSREIDTIFTDTITLVDTVYIQKEFQQVTKPPTVPLYYLLGVLGIVGIILVILLRNKKT